MVNLVFINEVFIACVHCTVYAHGNCYKVL